MNGITPQEGSPALPPLVSAFVRGNAPPLSKEQLDGIYTVGVRLYAREQYREAADVFRLVVLCRPRQACGWIALAACHEAFGEDEHAIVLYQAAALAPASNANRRRARVHLARLFARLGRHAEARDELDAIESEPDDGDESISTAVRDLRRCLADTLPSMETAQ